MVTNQFGRFSRLFGLDLQQVGRRPTPRQGAEILRFEQAIFDAVTGEVAGEEPRLGQIGHPRYGGPAFLLLAGKLCVAIRTGQLGSWPLVEIKRTLTGKADVHGS